MSGEHPELKRWIAGAHETMDQIVELGQAGAMPPAVEVMLGNLTTLLIATRHDLEHLLQKHGPYPACRECGMGGDVGGTEPNPIPF